VSDDLSTWPTERGELEDFAREHKAFGEQWEGAKRDYPRVAAAATRLLREQRAADGAARILADERNAACAERDLLVVRLRRAERRLWVLRAVWFLGVGALVWRMWVLAH